jgi:hypothetical protein
MKVRKGSIEVEGTPAEVAELLQHLDRVPGLLNLRSGLTLDKKLTLNDIWSIGDEVLREYIRKNPWHGPGAVGEHFFGRTILSTGDDRPLYQSLYRRIGDAREYWDTKSPGWNSVSGKGAQSRVRGQAGA